MSISTTNQKTFDTPIPEGLPIPNRKIIRSWIEPFANKTTFKAISLLVIDILIWFALIAGVVFIENLFVKLF
jgi:omega-6 fatty acid desaturase (delta-12 desaturase)